MKILIAGASSGIGQYLASSLSNSYTVFGTYRSTTPHLGTDYSMDRVDFTERDEVDLWVNKTCVSGDYIVFLYCVGVNYNCLIHKSESTKWREVIETNLIGVQSALTSVIPRMRVAQFGRIILFSSVVPLIGVPGTSAYSASKAALWGLCKAVASENAKYNITINSINLGYFDIGMIKDVPVEVLQKIVSAIPSGKLGNPINILNTVEYLISTEYITGAQINLNGGLY